MWTLLLDFTHTNMILASLVGCAAERPLVSTAPARDVGISHLTPRVALDSWLCLFQTLLQCRVPLDLECSQAGGSSRNASLLLWHKVRAGNRSESSSQSAKRCTAEKSHTRDEQGWWRRVGGSKPCDWKPQLKTDPRDTRTHRAITSEPSMARGFLYPNLRHPTRYQR